MKRRISFGSTPSLGPAKSRPSLGMARTRTTPITSRSKPLPTFRTPVISKMTPRQPSSLPNRMPLSSRKRPLASTAKPPRKVTPEEALAEALSHDNVLWILADSNHVPVDSLTVGDMVTVMGTVQPYEQKAPGLPEIQSKKDGKRPSFYVDARIVRKDNGANLRLHQEALQLRRKHLLETYHKGKPIPPGTPLLGCGPPPYNLC